jgi:hypothetical protein
MATKKNKQKEVKRNKRTVVALKREGIQEFGKRS